MLSRPAVASSATGHPAAFGSTSVSGPGQNASASRAASASKSRQRLRRREIGDVGDQRIEGRPALGRVKPRDRLAIGGVGAEPVNGLGRKRDQAAGREAAHRLGDRGGVGLATRVASGAVIAQLQCLNSACAQAQSRLGGLQARNGRLYKPPHQSECGSAW